jgi:hypothetical protein
LNLDEPDVAGQVSGVASGRKLGIVSDEFLVVSGRDRAAHPDQGIFRRLDVFDGNVGVQGGAPTS